ncbi:MAG: hypothetical protein DRN15_11335 [Thermoprotei archaeon]|nr:MAG: hypothetical protein DRN15_11335 [Thermoprotei archaeon]
MSSLEYALVFTGLIAYLMLSLSLITMPTPTFSLRVLLSAIASVAYRPTSEVMIRLYVPKDVVVSIHDDIIELQGYIINYGEVRDFIRLGIVKSYSRQRLELGVKLSPLRLTGSKLYVLRLSCPRAGQVLIRVVEIQRG